MRLIDADYLKNLPFERVIHTDFGDTAIPIKEIDNAPTVDTTFREVVAYECGQKSVEERPKGKWIHCEQVNGLGGYWKCSCCGEPAIFTPRLDIDNTQLYSWDNSKTNYCPKCGAQMVGGDQDV